MMIFLRTRRSMYDFTVRTVCKTRSECEYMYVVCDYLWSYEIRNTKYITLRSTDTEYGNCPQVHISYLGVAEGIMGGLMADMTPRNLP